MSLGDKTTNARRGKYIKLKKHGMKRQKKFLPIGQGGTRMNK